MALTVAELETIFTANVKDFEKKADTVDKTQKTLAKSAPEVKVGADNTKALAGMDRVQAEAKKIDGSTSTLNVKADTSSAKADIGGLGDEGGKAGKDAGKGLSDGIIGALVALPIAGTVVGIGVAIGKSLTDGLQVEVRSDRLMAQTGLDAESIAPIARAAGEAYGNNWGESIAANMDTARQAIQSGLLDPKKAAQDSQDIIESLAGVADILGEEIPRVSRSTAQLLRTGLAKDAKGAFDLLVKGTQNGLNVSEDLLDTVDEYGTQFRQLGLNGPQAFGLLSQAVKGGARDTDTAADALKEFAIRSVDMSKTSVAAFKALDIDAGKMADTMTKGGPKAAAALDGVLDKLRNVKDPSDQAALAVALFGTKAEDMGTALFDMDLSTAVAQLGNVKGAAKSALDTLGDNAAGSIASAQRNITVAADGIKGALATAFAPQIKGAATFVTENREAVMQFLLDMANGALDAGRALANAAANGIEGFGNLVGTVGPAMMGMIDGIMAGFANVANVMDPFGNLGIKDAANSALDDFREMRVGAEAGFKAVKDGSVTAADAIRTKLIKEGLDPAQARLNAVGIPLVAQAKMHDTALKLAKEIDNIKQGKVPGIDANTKAGKARIAELQRQIDLTKQHVTPSITANNAKAVAAVKATQAKINAIRQGKVPGVDASTAEGKEKLAALQKQITDLRSKTVTITANVHENYTRTNAHNLGSRAVGNSADGQTDWRGGLTWVGERGPEILNLPKGSQVLPNHKIDAFLKLGNLAEGTGSFVAADWASIGSRMPSTSTTASDVTAARLRQTKATQALHAAESALHTLRAKKGHTTAQVNAAENKLTNTRAGLRAATKSLHSTEASRAAAVKPLSTRVHSAATKSNAATLAFIRNIDTLRKRGFVVLADQLLMAADDQAYTLASQAVASSKVARTLTSDVVASADRAVSLSGRQNAVEARVAAGVAARERAATLGDYTAAAAGGVANTTKFYANLTKLADRGFNALAARLLDQSDEAAEIVAEQAVAASDQVVSGLNASITTATLQETTRQSLADRFAGTTAAVGTWANPDKAGVAYGSAPTDMSGVRADNAEQIQVLRSLVPGFTAALAGQARTIQTLQRQMAGAH